MKRLYKDDELIKNIAMVTGIIGASLMALNIGLFIPAYILFMTSSLFWSLYAWKTSNKQLLKMNVYFCLINFVGLIRFYYY